MNGETLIATVLGGIISIAASGWFYRRSGAELKEEATGLRRLNIMALRALQEAGLADLNVGPDGVPRGLKFRGTATDQPRWSDRATASVDRPAPPVYDRQHENPQPDA